MRLIAAAVLVGVALGVAFWIGGAFSGLGWWIAAQQRALQAALAGEISALRAGDGAAFRGFAAVCATYGFLHAIGPGHGKALIAGAAAGTRASAARLGAVAVIGSLAQAGVAIALVYGGLGLLHATARGLTEGAERWIAAAGNLAIAGIGAWLLARGIAALRSARAAEDVRRDAHHACGHAHGPDPAALARATGFWPTLALVAAMAARPCTGAIVVLVIAWRMDLAVAGALGVIAMGLGTASLTALVGGLAVTSRDAALLGAGGGAARLLAPALQVMAGALMLGLAGVALAA